MTKNRLEAFSDGVFAIVITLLVLELRVPLTTPDHLGEALFEVIPKLLAYIVSFFVVGVYWLYHHRNMHRVKQVNVPFLWLNLVWILFVSVVPFPTGLIGEYPLEPLPLTFYGIDLILTNVTGFFFMLYLKHHPELAAQPVTAAEISSLIPRYIGFNSVYAIGIALAWYQPWITVALYFMTLLWLIFSYRLTILPPSKIEVAERT